MHRVVLHDLLPAVTSEHRPFLDTSSVALVENKLAHAELYHAGSRSGGLWVTVVRPLTQSGMQHCSRIDLCL